LQSPGRMSLDDFLHCGHCEPLKAGVHATALGLFVVMGAYNVAAWLSRRERHLAINAVVYAALTAWEQQHVAHHLAELRATAPAAPAAPEPALTLPRTIAA
jgi:hypothetical protein